MKIVLGVIFVIGGCLLVILAMISIMRVVDDWWYYDASPTSKVIAILGAVTLVAACGILLSIL